MNDYTKIEFDEDVDAIIEALVAEEPENDDQTLINAHVMLQNVIDYAKHYDENIL